MNLNVLPLAVTMMAGPQIISAIILVTADRAVRVSLAFLCGVLAATVAGVAVARGLAGLLGGAPQGTAPGGGPVARIVEAVLVALLVVLAIRSFLGRRTAEPPRWLAELMGAAPRQALRTGLLVILLMPSDIIVMLTVGVHLQRAGMRLPAAAPFVAATVLIAALPLLAYLLFHRRAVNAMPKVRDWMNANSWLVNIIAYLVFIVLIVG
ncbi:GAP family protein [Actinomadura sp. NPDC047616]|uniref:GAP family protein n=1 Tax=Actinomadura sp. NPDC047616 TaxID=3155914 RepID=UPI003408D3A7